MATTYTVVRGDTLSEIAVRFNTTVSELVKLNDISDPDYIVVGQVLILSKDSSSSTSYAPAMTRVRIKVFGLQSNTDRTMYVTWIWNRSNTENYEVVWYYGTGDGVWFIGNNSTTEDKQSVYTAPTNAKNIKVKITPISKTHKVNDQDVKYWTASYQMSSVYSFSSNPPTTPPTPTVTIEKYKLTASLANLDVNATKIQFQVVKNDAKVFKSGTATIKTNAVSYSCTVDAGYNYKVRCRAVREKLYSAWSEYSNNLSTIPSAPTEIETLKALSESSVYISWTKVSNATSYEVQYTTKKSYFDSSDEVQSTTVESIVRHAEITGMETGEEYFFRVRAVNDRGESSWTKIKSIVIGKDPAAPTTWSSTTTVITGEPLTLYWVHNAEDGSSQTYAELELYIDGQKETHTIKNSTDEEEKDKTSSYSIDTSTYIEGTTIQWRVRTAGITKVYGDWSIQRSIDIYAPATLEIAITNSSGESIETVEMFPFYISGLAGPNTQAPIGYHVSIISNEIYETVDQIGNKKIVNNGEQVYSKYFDTSDPLLVQFSANNIDLETGISYTAICKVSMNSGLTAESTLDFTVAWTDIQYEPNAEISIDMDTLSASIRPYCEDENEVLVEDIFLSVYRREFDGGFTELATEIDNIGNTFITDPHPALDYARYRVIATSKTTGTVSYYDVPGYPIGEKAVIIQWDEQWSSFDTTNEDEMEQPPWSGSLIKLPYNIDVSDTNSSDVSLVQYIGRSHPVSYYGTQLGVTSTWNVVIEKDDEETLYALRRLAMWMGDVYVREPSGSGYWANIVVSFSQKHTDVTIPVTFDITRVIGGV